MAPSVDEVLREFVRYEGDGLGGIGALPVGDPQSGIYHPTKKDIRDSMGEVFAARDEVLALQDYIEGLVSDVVSQATVPIFSTVTAVQSYAVPFGMNVIFITGRAAAGTGGQYYVRTPGSTHPFRFTDGSGAVWQPTTHPALLTALSTASGGITVGVGSTGDYPDIPTAIESLRNYATKAGQRIELRLVSPITRGYLSPQGVNDGKFVLTNGTGAASVPLASGFVGVSDVGMGGNDRTDNLLAGFYSTLPTLGCVINMGNVGGSGYYGIHGSEGMVLQGCGIINAGYNALEWRAGMVAAYKTVWDGATVSGIRVAHAAMASVQESTANYCCKNSDVGYTAGAVDISRTSTAHFRMGSAKFSGAAGANVRRVSTLCCEEADFSGAAAYGMIVQHASRVSGWSMMIANTRRATGEMGYGIWLRDGEMNIQSSTITGSAGAVDIRIGDSSPDHSGASLNASNVTTTSGVNKIQNYMGATRFNLPGRYGTIWNASVPSPLSMLSFDNYGASRGAEFNSEFGFLALSSNDTAKSTLISLHNPTGQAGRVVSAGATVSIESTSDARLKRDLGPIDFDPYAWAMGVKIRHFEWLADGTRQYGPFAQELYETDPYAVGPGEGAPGDDEFRPWMLDFSKLGPKQHLVIQKLIEHVRLQDEAIADLKSRLREEGL